MKKFNVWPIFFIGLFSFGLGMVIWTVYNAGKLTIQEDQTFLNTYRNVDDNFNAIAQSNVDFLQNYEFELNINNNTFPLSYEDAFYSQRVIQKKSLHKNVLKHEGENTIAVIVKDKISNEVIENVQIALRITSATDNKKDIDLDAFDFKNNQHQTQFNIPNQGNWNITGVITTNDHKGYFLIKTNAM
jgi:hypothetical protein